MATNPYQVSADATAAYAAGYSQMLEHLAQQEAGNQQSFLNLIGAPPEAIDQYNQAAAFPADVLYGAYGVIPGTSLSQQGAAFGEATAGLPGIFGNQLSFSANIHAQEMAQQNAMAQAQMNHARQMAAADMAASSGGEAGGLTPYQAASLEMRAMEFATEQDRYARQDELDWLKFEAEINRQDQEDEAELTAMTSTLSMLGFSQKEIKNIIGTSGVGGDIGPILDIYKDEQDRAADAAEAAADAKAERLENRTEKRQDIRGLIASQFNGLEPGMNKKQAVSTIMGAISTQYPKFAGWKPDRVRNMVRQHVNSQWENRSRPDRGGTGVPGVRGRINSTFEDFVQGLDTPTVDQDFLRRYRNVAGYRSAMSQKAVNSITGALRDSMTPRTWEKNRTRILKMVRNHVRRNRGHFKVNRRPAPSSSGSYTS